MGTWGSGLLEGDGSLFYLNGLEEHVQASVKSVTKRSSPEGAARLATSVGLLLQFSGNSFVAELPFSKILAKAVSCQDKFLDDLGKPVASILRATANGASREELLKQAKAKAPPKKLAKILGSPCPSPAVACLFDNPEAARVVQEFADFCAELLDANLGDDDLDITDAGFLSALAVLLVIEPYTLEQDRVEGWLKETRALYARTDDGEAEEWGGFMENADAAFRLALTKTSPKQP